MKLYEKYSGRDLFIAERIQQRRRQMIVHSRLYYILDTNLVSDHKWADWGLELVCLQNEFPYIAREVPLAEYFVDWDASSGAHLPLELPWAISVCDRLLKGESA